MKNYALLLLSLSAALMITACGGRKEIRITEGTEPVGSMPSGTVYATKDATIVHVDLNGRMATIRRGNIFEDGAFLVVKDSEGKQTGVLKALPKRVTGLRTADVLEGEPDINNTVSRASPSETERLSKIYRDPEQE